MMRTDLIQASTADGLFSEGLLRLAIEGLGRMFDAERQLFCYRLKRSSGQLISEGSSYRYTIIALLGLHRAESAGLKSDIDIRRAVSESVKNTSWIRNVGDLGLLLWLCALKVPDRLSELCSRVGPSGAMKVCRDARQARTTELAWFLSGLSHAALAMPNDALGLANLARQVYDLLAANQSVHGIFGHLAIDGTLIGRLRGSIGSFADQVYPIYALAKYAQAYSVPEALELAEACAVAICRVQGPLGQWWWHYNAATGRVCEKYPVYSVHQDGMGPMALFALGEVTGLDFGRPIHDGLQWIAGNNELSCDLRDVSSSVIWRSIFHGTTAVAYYRKALAFSGGGWRSESIDDLRVNFECRPYHFGWLLYALAGRNSNANLPASGNVTEQHKSV